MMTCDRGHRCFFFFKLLLKHQITCWLSHVRWEEANKSVKQFCPDFKYAWNHASLKPFDKFVLSISALFYFLAPEHVIAHSLLFEELTGKKTKLFLLIFVLAIHTSHTWLRYKIMLSIPCDPHKLKALSASTSTPPLGSSWAHGTLSMWDNFHGLKLPRGNPACFSMYLAILTMF